MSRMRIFLAILLGVLTVLAVLILSTAVSKKISSSSGDRSLTLTYVTGSAVKVEQLLGDYDKSTKHQTKNLTEKRFSLIGSDLGYPFEYHDKIIFLFGDCIGTGGGHAIGYSFTKDPDQGLLIDMYKGGDGTYLKIAPPGVSTGPFEVPVCGITANNIPYVWVKNGHDTGSEHSILTRFDESELKFTVVREFSSLPAGKFIEMTAHIFKGPIPGIQNKGPFIIIMGAQNYRESNPYLCVIPENDIETGLNTKYFKGLDKDGSPQWSSLEQDAAPVFVQPTIGNLSLTWVKGINQWILVYDSRDPSGILLRHADFPWGKWSEPETIFNPTRDNGYGNFIHEVRVNSSDGLAGPVIGRDKKDWESVWGGAYAPFVIEKFTRMDNNTITLYFLLSTWNPYTVDLMQAKLSVRDSGSRQ